MRKTPNFLHNLEEFSFEKIPSRYLFWVSLATLVFIFSLELKPIIAVGMVGLLLLWLLVRFPTLGLSLTALTTFFIGWEINFSLYRWARDIPYLPSINAPLGDFVVLLAFGAMLFMMLLRLNNLSFRTLFRSMPGWLPYGLFLLVAAFSVWHAGDVFGSLRYWARPMVFVYLVYLVFPIVILRTFKNSKQIFTILFWVGAAIAAMGTLSYILDLFNPGWPRVHPLSFRGLAPLGYNHNVLAEALVALIPIGWIVALTQKGERRVMAFTVVGAMIFSALLTFSRAAWLALGVQGFIALWYFRKPIKDFVVRHELTTRILMGVVAAITIGMSIFLFSTTVTTSNASRLAATDAIWHMTTRSPWIGYGPGMYKNVLAEASAFVLDFGEPLDAHGFIQKIILEDGFLGLALFLAFLIAVFARVRPKYLSTIRTKPMAIAMFAMVVGVVVFQLFNTSYFNSHMWFPLGIALAMSYRDTDV